MIRNKRRLPQYVSVAIAGTLLLSGAGPAIAAPEDDETMEEIVVKGIRGSMQQSLERKRNSDHFVDALTAEDIGAFPDQNLAESLQRLSGVAIDRKSGEGAFVSVRGLGPQFVMSTINGRAAASNVSPGSHDGRGSTNAGSRAISFDQFQSGLVNAVEVHKSPRADHVEGGLGGFVDVQTRRPLDLGKRHIAFAVDATRNDLSDDTAPGVFALYSDSLTDTFGFMVSAQWDNRVFRTDSLHHYSYLGDPRTTTINGVALTGYYPRQILGEMHTTDRDRLNVSSSVQWRPSDRVDVSFDLLFTENKAHETDFWRDFRLQQGHGNITDATLSDDNGTGIFTEISTSGAGLFVQHATEDVNTDALTFGANLAFQATDRLSFNVDFSISETDSPITNRDYLIRNTNTQMTYRAGNGVRPPSLTTTSPISDVSWFSVVKHSIQDHLVDDQNSQFRVDMTYDFFGDWLQTFQAGVRVYRQERGDRHRYLNSRAFINDDVNDFGGDLGYPDESGFLSGLGATFPNNIVTPNLDSIQQTFVTRADEVRAGGGFNTGTGKSLDEYNSGRFNEDLNHNDDGQAFYAMVTFRGDLGDIPYSGNFGVRYVDNDTGTVGEVAEPISIDYSDPSQPEIVLSPPTYLDVGHGYTETLPSLNLRFDPRDDLIVRLSWAKVLSRPSFNDLNPRQSVQPNPRTMRGGNGELDPTTATQFDLAVEWYFADYSIVSFGFFTKDIESFVTPEITSRPFAGLIDPDTNQPLVFSQFRPLNAGGSDLRGFEFAFQRTAEDLLPAPFDGLGVIANYTYIDSGSDFVNDKTGAAYGIPGLSENTINLSLFYEKGPYRARVSYNNRDEFLDQVSDGSGHPYFVDQYEQWDLSFGYTPRENLSFALEAINLTDENVYYYNLIATGTQKYFSSAIHAGRRFQFGVRYSL